MPAPIEIRLTASQRQALERQRAAAKSPRVWARITAILMLAAKVPATKVGALLSVCLGTITNWKRRWLQGGHFRFKDRAHTGRKSRANARYLRLLREAVERGPQAYGYIFTVWSVGRLAAHLAIKTKVRLGAHRVRQLLHQLDYVFGCPKHTLKSRQNRRKVRSAKKHLQALKKGLCGPPRNTSSGSRTRPTSICIPI
jgi:transposase